MQIRRQAIARRATHFADRLFLAGCIGAYLMLVATVFTALRIYPG